ncbi:MAG: M48 family metallopeptidase [Lachnospiraceae bacterium]
MKTTAEHHEIKLREGTLNYTLERKRVKNINLHIKSDGTVWVSASERVPVEEIEAFILRKQEFIKKAIAEFDEKRKNAPKPKQYESGETFYFLGKPLCLQIQFGEVESVKSDGERLYLTLKEPADFQKKERLVKNWFQKKAREICLQVTAEVYLKFEPYGIAYPQVAIRKMTSRWGSCQPQKGKITLNAHLISTPRTCIEYVVVHEFAHFLHPNHAKAFWAFVESMLPDYRERRKELETYGNLVIDR